MVSVSSQATLRRWVGRFNWVGVAIFIALFVIWQIVVSQNILGAGQYDSLPTPTEIIDKGYRVLIDRGTWQDYLGHTLKVVAVSWVLGGVILGIAVGLLLGLSRRFYDWTMASWDFMRALPGVAFVPIVLLVWGVGEKSEIILGTQACFWPMMLGTAQGVRQVSPRLTDVARTFQMSRFDTIRKIVIPSTTPFVLVGARLSMAVALIVIVVFEMIGTPNGLGWGVTFSNQAIQYEQMWAYALTIGFVGFTLNALIVNGSRWLFPGASQLMRGDG